MIPQPNVIASETWIRETYPTKAGHVAVEILSQGEDMSYTLGKCEAYVAWGFPYVYIVDPDRRRLYRVHERGLTVTDQLVSIPVSKIWDALDRAASGRPS